MASFEHFEGAEGKGRRGRIQCLEQQTQRLALRSLSSRHVLMHLLSAEASFPGPADLSTGLGHERSYLTGSENAEERVEEGRHEGCSSERHRLRHPVHSGHKQHVSTRSLLEGEERGA